MLLAHTTIRFRLWLSLGIFASITLLMVLVMFWFDARQRRVRQLTDVLRQMNLKVERAAKLEKDFYIIETINPAFYETGNSALVAQHSAVLDEIKENLAGLRQNPMLKDAAVDVALDSITTDIDLFRAVFDSLVMMQKKRGFKNFGLEGEIQAAINRVVNSGYDLNELLIANIRKLEKEFLIQKNPAYVGRIKVLADSLEANAIKTIREPVGREFVVSSLEQYRKSLDKLVENQQIIGAPGQGGLQNELMLISARIEERIAAIDSIIEARAQAMSNNLRITQLVLFALLLGLMFSLGFFLMRSISRPLRSLSNAIREVVDSNFDRSKQFFQAETNDEVGQLSKNFAYLLQMFYKRTDEVEHQKEALQASNTRLITLRKMGQRISAVLDVEELIRVLYEELSTEMVLPTLIVCIADRYNRLIARGYHNGAWVEGIKLNLDTDTAHVAVHIFLHQQKIISSQWPTENTQSLVPFFAEENPQTVIGLLMTAKEKPLGVLVIQSPQQDAFNEVQLSIIRNMGVYTTIALDNALLYESMEDTVQERTAEVLAQKEEIERQKHELEDAFDDVKRLSEIGKTISSYLDADKIAEQVYRRVNDLMDADTFGIGILRPETNTLEFVGVIENNERLPTFSYSLDNPQSLAVYAVKNERELVINHWEQEAAQYPMADLPESGAHPQSLVYIPLRTKNAMIGILTVQSFQAHAYNDYDLNLLRNLAIYVAIALENANAFSEIARQRESIQKNNEKITASLNYASRIQSAMLPDLAEISRCLPDSFVFFRPRDIVSGDFYWLQEKDGKVLLAAVDCTGHGVPGAFMSMIGIDILNEIVNEKGITEPDQILNLMHQRIRQALKQEITQNRDGMDIALCVIDETGRKLTFSGARTSIVYCQHNQLLEIKGDNVPIGGLQREQDRIFTRHIITTETPTTFYLFTDGYKDQFGGENNTKLTARAFKQLLFSMHRQPAETQKTLLANYLEEWMGSHPQLDDILVMGVKI
ncbi:GAF domain-containing protein [Rhodoflexus caldus]|uniref:GAF domain-containing protein n=1 Tax=Rhodoflexus caldus TaxID=2891236 RepID=UPI002029D3E6|nr:GAF domain-containing protein [Rhodoflexus caldus]